VKSEPGQRPKLKKMAKTITYGAEKISLVLVIVYYYGSIAEHTIGRKWLMNNEL
jgi:hypothetical protein